MVSLRTCPLREKLLLVPRDKVDVLLNMFLRHDDDCSFHLIDVSERAPGLPPS